VAEQGRSMDNRYVARLGLSEAPSVEAAYERVGQQIHRLMVVAILERGAPLDLEQMVARLARAGVRSRIGDLGVSIQKAWAGRPPIYRDTWGRFDLDLHAIELEWILRDLGLRPPTQREPIPHPTPEPLPIGAPDEPLSRQEVAAAFQDGSLHGLAAYRQVAAVLEAYGSPQSTEDVESTLKAFTKWRYPFDPTRVRYWKTTLVRLGEDGLLHLNPTSPDIADLRASVRRMAKPRFEQAETMRQGAVIARAFAERDERTRAERAARERASSHAVLRLVRLPNGAPSCAALIDVERRDIRTFLPAELAAILPALRAYDVLSGLDVRESLEVLGVDPHAWRLEELRPQERTWKLNRAGRRLPITFELVSSSTTGIARPLGTEEKLSDYVAQGAFTKLRRRLESDVKALYAFRQYAVLHGYVRLHWGFLDEFLSLDWAYARPEPLLGELKAAMESRQRVEVVLGSAPAWGDPWSRARSCRVLQILSGQAALAFEDKAYAEAIPFEDIQAMRRIEDGQSVGSPAR